MSPVLEALPTSNRAIQRIGPIEMDQLIEPASIGLAQGGRVTATFGVASRVRAEQLEELVNNPLREQEVDGVSGVLEWVETTGALEKWRGWWLLSSVSLDIRGRQIRAAEASANVPVSLTGLCIGPTARVVVAATHRERVDEFTLAGQALLAPLYPSLRIEGSATLLTRAGDGLSLGLRKSSAKREPLRVDPANFDPLLAGARPSLRGPDGTVHYGPPRRLESATAYRLQTPFVRVTISHTAGGHWLVEAWVAGAWTPIGALRVRRTTAAGGHAWSIASAEFRDDEIALLLVNDYDATTIRVALTQGELGMRLEAGASYYLQWLTTTDGAAGAATKTANTYQDAALLPSGARRMMALLNAAMTDTIADWLVRIDVGDPAFVGYVPAAPQADDVATEQGRQFLFERDERLVLE